MSNSILKISILIVSFACFGFAFNADHSDNCNCTPKESYRINAKHETNTSGYHVHPGVIDVKVMNSWKNKYSKVMKGIGKKKVDMTKGRVKNCPEDSIYNFDGYLYSIATGEADCDLHMECGLKNSKIRVGLEITAEKCKLQNDIIDKLQAKGFKISKKDNTPVHITAKGFGFYDGWHGRWELHPVFELEVLDN